MHSVLFRLLVIFDDPISLIRVFPTSTGPYFASFENKKFTINFEASFPSIKGFIYLEVATSYRFKKELNVGVALGSVFKVLAIFIIGR